MQQANLSAEKLQFDPNLRYKAKEMFNRKLNDVQTELDLEHIQKMLVAELNRLVMTTKITTADLITDGGRVIACQSKRIIQEEAVEACSGIFYNLFDITRTNIEMFDPKINLDTIEIDTFSLESSTEPFRILIKELTPKLFLLITMPKKENRSLTTFEISKTLQKMRDTIQEIPSELLAQMASFH